MNILTVAFQLTVTNVLTVSWQAAIEPFLNTLDSPPMRRSYQGDSVETMPWLKIGLIGEITAPQLTEYRAGLVACLDVRGRRRLSPATVGRKLAAMRSFLRFCRPTGLTRVKSEVISLALKSPRATVSKPYEVLTHVKLARALVVLRDRPRDRALVTLALGTRLRAAELTAVRVGDQIGDDDRTGWLHVVQGKGRGDRMIPLSIDVAQFLREYATQC